MRHQNTPVTHNRSSKEHHVSVNPAVPSQYPMPFRTPTQLIGQHRMIQIRQHETITSRAFDTTPSTCRRPRSIAIKLQISHLAFNRRFRFRWTLIPLHGRHRQPRERTFRPLPFPLVASKRQDPFDPHTDQIGRVLPLRQHHNRHPADLAGQQDDAKLGY